MIEFLSSGWKLASLYLVISIYLCILVIMYLSIIDDESILNKICKKAFILLTFAMIAYPILFIIHAISPNGFALYLLYTDYLMITWDAFTYYWQWIIVFMLIPLTCRGSIYSYAALSIDLQIKRLESENKRWLGTPYLAPLLTLHVLHPPEPMLWRIDKKNRIYHMAIDTLREFIYFKFEMKYKKPINKPRSWFLLVPASAYYKLLLYLVIIVGLVYYLLDNNPYKPFSEGYKFFVPILCGLIARIIGVGYSIINHATWGKTKRIIEEKFGTSEHLVLWTDLNRDQPLAQKVIDAWIKIYEEEKGKAKGTEAMTPMPEPPYVSKEIPIWTDDHVDYVQKYINQKPKHNTQERINKQSKSNIVQFKK